MCVVGCNVASALASNACLLYVPPLLNRLGYQVASEAGFGTFGSWASGQATLSLSYYRIEAIVKAAAGVVGVKLGELLADGILWVFDVLVQCIIKISERIFKTPNPDPAATKV